MKSWLEKNVIEMYSTENEGKSVVAERFIRTLKNKIYKYMTLISKIVYIDKLDNIVNKYNDTCHRAIKMKPVDVKRSTYIDSSKETRNEDPKFKIGDIVRILKYKKNIFAKSYVTNWKFFLLKKLKTLCRGKMVLVILKVKKLFERFTKKYCKKRIKKSLKSNKEKRQ